MNRCTSVTSCDHKMPSSFLRLCALGESEVADPCLPVCAARRRRVARLCVVLVSIIERAVVHRINGHIAVIAPAEAGFLLGIAVAIHLAAGAVKKMLFT